MGFLDGKIVNSEYRAHDENGNQIEPDFLICNGYSTCSEFISKSSINEDVNLIN